MKTKQLIICALLAAIISLTAPFSILIGPVPVTFVLFSLALAAFTCGSRLSAVATLVYIGLGIVGLPVFSNFKAGISAIASPTGGFVFSYVLVVLILGLCTKTTKKGAHVLLCVVSLLVCYFFGTAWYILLTKAGVKTALTLCVVPFIPFDVIKLFLAYIVANAIRKRVNF